ncbi:aminoglycoside phosphotransferase family protein [Brachybacterium halotolerans subsp. kimchii]|uniref:phosphotransferase family protein n=1 Tax=Brachybacterium halotolerans TaxID=2795215 RepID=UPI001E39FB6B|nr:aminoglycoside phosphotransferase family protein [Brachybacterium halotolerans]UEJ81291.1 aminoglycoside phosphotransferase family protein [Brachybacterium halotolerans subsp. kimchii]
MTGTPSPATASVPTPPAAASPQMGKRIQRAWHEETLLLPLRDAGHARRLPGQSKHSRLAGLGGPAHVELLGTGETFAAWRLRAEDGTALLVRIPWHAPAHPLADELAALTQLPPDVGPEPLALHDDAESSPLGAPYLVTTPVPGRILAPAQWTRDHLAAHAERLAHLHRVATPGRGPVTLGADPWERMESGRLSLLELFEADTESVDAEVLAGVGGPGILRSAAQRLRAADSAFADLEGFVLSHGDLCATNIVWDAQVPRFIDFEWSMGDDPARDLAIIGGPVHGGPWYVPLAEEDIEDFMGSYLHARTRLDDASELPRLEGQTPLLPARTLDPAGLRARRDAWEVFEKTAMLLHVAGRVAERRAADDHYSTALPILRDTLRARLGAD